MTLNEIVSAISLMQLLYPSSTQLGYWFLQCSTLVQSSR